VRENTHRVSSNKSFFQTEHAACHCRNRNQVISWITNASLDSSCKATFSKQMDVAESKFDISDLRKCVGVFRNLADLHSVALAHPFHSTEQTDIQTGPRKSLSLAEVFLFCGSHHLNCIFSIIWPVQTHMKIICIEWAHYRGWKMKLKCLFFCR